MKKILLVVVTALICGGAYGLVSDSQHSSAVAIDLGDTGTFQVVSVGTVTAAVVYSTTTVSMSQIRDVRICNSEAFDLFVGTFSAVDAVNANRMYVPQNGCQSVPFGLKLWGIYESGAGAAKAVTSVIWSQSGQ